MPSKELKEKLADILFEYTMTMNDESKKIDLEYFVNKIIKLFKE